MSDACCRVCLQVPELHVSIFTVVGDRMIAATITEISGVQISETDHLPKVICVPCVESVVVASHIRRRCIESDQYLRETYAPTKEQPSTVHDSVFDDHLEQTTSTIVDYASEARTILEASSAHDGSTILTHISGGTGGQTQPLPKGFLEALNSTGPPQPAVTHPQHCCGCELSFQTETALHEHSLVAHYSERIVSDTKPFECDICYMRFLDGHLLKLHAANRSLRYRCRSCDKRFVDRNRLLFHEKCHRREEDHGSLACPVCTRMFRCNSSLRAHVRLHTIGPTDRKFQCSSCDRCFLRRSDLRSHQISHTSDTPFACCHCSMKFKRKQHLTAHVKIHEGHDSTYKCRHCADTFAHQSTRAYHEITKHTGNYPFSCGQCGKKFCRKPIYEKHLKRHYGVKA